MKYASSESPQPMIMNRPSQSGFMPMRPVTPVTPVTPEYVPAQVHGYVPPGTVHPTMRWKSPAPVLPQIVTQSTIAPPGIRHTYSMPPKPSLNRTKKRSHRVMLVIGVIGLLSIVLGFWFLAKNSSGVTLYQVSQSNVTQYVGGGGIIYPQKKFDLSYSLPERVTSLLVKAGDTVSTNQPLIQLDPSQLNAQITQAFNDMDAAQVYLDSVSTNGKPVAIAQAQQAYNQAKDRYNALVAEYSSPLVSDGTLISPMDGIVTSVNINSGEVFSANTPLLTIMDESKVVVHVEIPLTYLGTVHTGQSALVTPSASPNSSFNGTVSSIIPQADPQTDTFEVWIEVPNQNGSLLPGMSAFVQIQQHLSALVVPRLAVFNPDRESNVFVVRQQHAFLQHVSVVGHSVDEFFISSGLAKGDLVVLEGAATLQDGQSVHVQNIETATGQSH